jgi:membrane protease YdiL (CAAX protease family)
MSELEYSRPTGWVVQALLLLLCALVGTFLASVVWVAFALPGRGVAQLMADMSAYDPTLLRWFQVASSAGFFLGGPLLYAAVVKKSVPTLVAWNGSFQAAWMIKAIVLVVLGSLAGGEVMAWLQLSAWPEGLAGIQALLLENDQANQQAVDAILAATGPGSWAVVFLTVALVPAVVEEVFFRGALYGIMQERGHRFAFWGSSLLFAAVHLQFFAFPGLLFIGLALGAVRRVTGHIQYGIWAHLVNNGALVVYLLATGTAYSDPSTVASTWQGLAAVVAFPVAVWWVLRTEKA